MSKHSADLLKNATLLLAGHGSSRPGGENPVHAHAESLRSSGPFAQVLEGYLKQPPLLDEILAEVISDDLFVVPMLTGHGYITDELIPGTLSKFAGAIRVHMCEPIGCHPAISELLAGNILTVMADNDLAPGSVSAVLAAHGNRTNPQNARQANSLAAVVSDKAHGVTVTAAFIEETPLISDWYKESRTENLIVLPYLIGGGLHGSEDVPTMIGLDPLHPELQALGLNRLVAGPFTAHNQTIWYCRAFGHDPALSDLIIDLVKNA